MELEDILSRVDHTLLSQEAGWEDIKELLDEGLAYKTASVCIPPVYVERASEYLGGRLKVCTVIGFPNGYNSKASKVFEAMDAIANGADEIDMVININEFKDKNYAYVLQEIKDIKAVCKGKPLKVIVETCLLNEEEKIKICQIVTEAGADYIKTSTGFSKGGATFEDIILFKENVGNSVRIKASGGIGSIEDAEKFIGFGADRLGTSRIVKIAKGKDVGGY